MTTLKHDVSLRVRRSRLWFSGETGAILIFLLFAIAYYNAAYWSHPNLPRASTQWGGWFGWFDQGQYYRSLQALEREDFTPTEHLYPIGYPLMGTLFYRFMPLHPFLIPDIF